MTKRILVVLGAAGLALALAASPAYAQYGQQPSVSVDDPTLVLGQTFTATAVKFDANVSVSFSLNSTPVALGTATSDANGTASVQGTVPQTFDCGDHTVTATGNSNGVQTTVSTNVTVSGCGAGTGTGTGGTGTGSGSGSLPKTGSDTVKVLLPLGAVLIAGGALTVIITRKRGTATA